MPTVAGTVTDASGNTATWSASWTVATPTPIITEYVDFTQHASGRFFGGTSLVGEGVKRRVYQLRPGSSTKGDAVGVLVKPQTNPYRVLTFGGLSASQTSHDLEIAGFTIQGTEQGHEYGGVRVGYSEGAIVRDVAVTGIPGSAPGPPGETFSLATWHADDYLFERVVLDGRNTSGAPVAATLLGINDSAGGTVVGMVANHAKHGFGAALWQSSDLTFEDCDFRYNRKAINIENSRGGFYRFVGCDFRNTLAASYFAQVSSTIASSRVTFEDCVFDNDVCLVRHYPGQVEGKQNPADIRRIDGGVDVTSNSAKFRIVTTG